MLLIDRDLPTQDIILTLDGDEISGVMDIKNDATRQEYSIELGDNITTAPERYDLFRVDTSIFDGMQEGYYSYFINSPNGFSVETGKLLIKPQGSAEPTIAPPNINDYLVYPN